MRYNLGIGLMRYGTLTRHGLISSQDHSDVVAALLVPRRLPTASVQPRLGDSLYLIGEPKGTVVKIGRAGNVERRLRILASGSPVRIVLRHVKPGLGPAETDVHKALDDRRRHGEWFDFSDAEPVQAVHDALRAIPALDWLWRLPAARETITAEIEAGPDWRPRRVQAMLREANRAYESGEISAPAAGLDGQTKKALLESLSAPGCQGLSGSTVGRTVVACPPPASLR
ncbi:MAG: GIY-YIG nuclease family protein [Streptosporangiaceae bacterium]